MIASPHALPFVRWSPKRVVPLSEGWVMESIYQSALLAGVGIEETTRQVAYAVVHYLEHDYPLNTIEVHELRQLISLSLNGVGCTEIAEHVLIVAPRVNIYLPDIARSAPYELLFFDALRHRLDEALDLVVRGIYLQGLRPCVKLIQGHAAWKNKCQLLGDEIIQFSRTKLAQRDALLDLVIS